ncbi:hypothetical protein [Falsarthrobacter nasiphocae]|uniref:Lipopolysaccharide export LptBFGC system permease protein LptF n=1 Tax=Falsarthrobacter nasiphocae TaxID=189863 RepID=A0AAE4C6L0_9MICC|nr:hypothetical protein [Falsarthrobacter nasiphocae]MDR6891579.1 lipopolysaccharide export LptBFGC system permease protein LptF [Falsarthrobacter nasiphocae]
MAQPTLRSHSGEGNLVGNIVIFAVLLAILLAGFFVLQYADFGVIWPFVACIALVSLAYVVPMAMSRSSSRDARR